MIILHHHIGIKGNRNMYVIDRGILEPSYMEFLMPSTFTQEALYYITELGHFYCDTNYQYNSDGRDSFLLAYILSGKLRVETANKKDTALAHQIIFLDCREKHKYDGLTNLEFLWIRINGHEVEKYYHLLCERSGFVLEMPNDFGGEKLMRRIITYAKSVNNEHMTSVEISRMLAVLAQYTTPTDVPSVITNAMTYIKEHYSEPLTREILASKSNLSVRQFSREFKKYTSFAPHDYLIDYRLRQAKIFLISSEDSMEEIAYHCGFSSQTHFARTFRTRIGMTPSDFRRMPY